MGHDRQISQLFDRASKLPRQQRNRFLDQACAGTVKTRMEVERLLRNDKTDFLEQPMANLAGLWSDRSDETVGIRPGTQLNGYRILELIGHGGMGAVYRAERTAGLHRGQVAIKVLLGGLVGHHRMAAFRRECLILARMDNPYIARLYDSGVTAEGKPYFVMEYVRGQPIDRYCDQKQLTVRSRLALFDKVCTAVFSAHRKQVVHRDLKPGNILVTAAGEPKLLDFGIARTLSRDSLSITATLFPRMTPAYASPEQVSAGRIGIASDIYSLGVLLYRLLTGVLPYHLDYHNPLALARTICESQPIMPSTAIAHWRKKARAGHPNALLTLQAIAHSRDLSPQRLVQLFRGDIDHIVLKALRKEPTQRYQTVEHMRQDIQRYLDGQAVLARKGSILYRLGKCIQRQKRELAIAALSMLLIGNFSLRHHFQQKQSKQQHQQVLLNQRTLNSFIQDSIARSDPYENQRAELPLGETLDQITQLINSKLLEPEIHAAGLNALGKAYRNRGLYDKARLQFEKAITLRRQLHGDQHPDVAESLHELGSLLLSKDEFVQAESYLRRAIAIRQYQSSPAAIASKHMLASALQGQGRFAAAEALIRKSLASHNQRFGIDHSATLNSMNLLGLVLTYQGKFRQAESLMRQHLQLRTQVHGEQHLLTSNALNNLGWTLREQGKLEEAKALSFRAWEMRQQILTEAHPLLALSLNTIGVAVRDEGRFRQAEIYLQQSADMHRSFSGSNSESLVYPLINMAILDLEVDNLAAAESAVREARDIVSAKHPHDHWLVAWADSVLGECLSRRGDHAGAETLLANSYLVLRKQRSEHALITQRAWQRLRQHYQRGTNHAITRLAITPEEDS